MESTSSPPPPLPVEPQGQGGVPSGSGNKGSIPQNELPAARKGVVYVAAPRFEPKPWVKNLAKGVRNHTLGTARVDLRRPHYSDDYYDHDNIFYCRRRGDARNGVQRWLEGLQRTPSTPVTGARLKVMRHLQIGPKLASRPGERLLDIGVGLNYEMDGAQMQPCARLRFLDCVRVAAFPKPRIKFQQTWVVGSTGLAVRAGYSLPLGGSIREPWRPPARLMVSLENHRHGIQCHAGGIDYDQRRIDLGKGVTVRFAGGFKFPRQLPLEAGAVDLGWHVERLGLRATW